MKEQDREQLLNVLLAVAAGGLLLSLLCAIGWYRTSRSQVDLHQLSSEQRQELVDELIDLSPGVHAVAWFEPRIGYTLRRNQQVTAWDDSFRTNSLGYRSPPPEKSVGTFRVLFVGDSWTYGMGVREDETFAQRFAALANESSGSAMPIESWTLALPGYNTLAEVAALGFFYERLEPDVVVICPTPNDNHSLSAVLPNGSLSRTGLRQDGFGEGHSVVYRRRWVDSFRYRDRWRLAFEQIRSTEERLRSLEVPMLLFFTGSWKIPMAHRLVAEAGLSSPYVITPPALTTEKWRNPRPIGHPNQAAHKLYGRLIYRALAEMLGWSQLPVDPKDADLEVDEGAASELHQRPEAARWIAASDRLLTAQTRAQLPSSFHAGGKGAKIQCAGPLVPETGLMGWGTTILLRRPTGSRNLAIAVRRLVAAPSLYPLELTVSIPSTDGGRQVMTTVPAEGPELHHFEIELPTSIAVDAAIDVIFSAERTVALPDLLAPASLYIESIEPHIESIEPRGSNPS